MPLKETHDIQKGRVTAAELKIGFCDLHPPLDAKETEVESARCYFCHDAPCIQACPTGIDIPNFIRKISTGNLKGAATDILAENIMGGTCARVCPVETLCQSACVRNSSEDKPVEIGNLQRVATDWLFAQGEQPFERRPSTGKRIAVIGAGPAGLSCAHRLSILGHECVVFEAQPKSGGLNEYGLAAYKMVDDWAQKEIEFITGLGGIEIKTGQALGRDVQLSKLRQEFDAVFIGTGLGGVNALSLQGEDTLPGVIDAVAYIERIRQEPLEKLPVGRRVVVIGAGNTAIDIAVQIKRLGAEEVTLVYRRGKEAMKATSYEQELAQTNGVLLRTWARPHALKGTEAGVTEVVFERTRELKGRFEGTGEYFTLQADQVFKAIGQKLDPEKLDHGVEIAGGRILVDEEMRTSLPGVYAGGDCVNGGDLTVRAVQDGKIAAHSIHAQLTGEKIPHQGFKRQMLKKRGL